MLSDHEKVKKGESEMIPKMDVKTNRWTPLGDAREYVWSHGQESEPSQRGGSWF